jgi:hypothetical protein
MSTIQSFFDSQLTNEAKKYTTDFGEFFSSGASIAAAASTSASYQQTLGGAASGSCAMALTGGSLVTHTSPALSAAGAYTFTVAASCTDGQVRKALWYVSVNA